MKKLLSLLLILAMAASIAGAASAAEVDPASVTGEITFWTAWTEDRGVANWIAEFNEIYPNITVTPVQYSNSTEGNLKLNASLLTSDVDVVLNYNYSNTMQRVSSGLFMNLDSYTQADGTDYMAEWGLDTEYEGGHYVLPVGGNTDKVFVNLDMVEEAGLTLPETWTLEEYVDLARKLTKGEGADKVYGASDMHAGHIYWGRLARGVLGNNYYYNEEGLSNFDDPLFEEALAFKYNMEEVEKIQYPYLEYKTSGAQVPDTFVSGKVAMCVCTGMMARWLKDTELYPRDFKVGVMPMPSLVDGADNYNDGVYYFSFLGVNANSAYPEAAYLFAKWFATEGSKGLSDVGHVPLWKNADMGVVATSMFGDNADGLLDMDSIVKNFFNYDGLTYLDDNFTAYSDVENISREYFALAITGELTPAEAVAEMKEAADAAILDAE